MATLANQIRSLENKNDDLQKLDYHRAESTDDENQMEYYSPKTVKTNICKFKTEMCKNYS